ncbi:MAG: hypothetical protein UU61_C0034G0002 [Parcubacteria group bacterium GW2011_GWB1_41_4]|nr:MAG: hypothetical protein UU61_C0034G0002 [Parcubacteria group bacterium GW2011_GWB1_41_4]
MTDLFPDCFCRPERTEFQESVFSQLPYNGPRVFADFGRERRIDQIIFELQQLCFSVKSDFGVGDRLVAPEVRRDPAVVRLPAQQTAPVFFHGGKELVEVERVLERVIVMLHHVRETIAVQLDGIFLSGQFLPRHGGSQQKECREQNQRFWIHAEPIIGTGFFKSNEFRLFQWVVLAEFVTVKNRLCS